MDDVREADVEMTSSDHDLPINATSPDNQSEDLLLNSSGISTPTRMEGVDSLTDLVNNVSLRETRDTPPKEDGKSSNVSSNFQTPLPPRNKPSRSRRSQSVTSFVSACSSPENSITTIPKSQRTIKTYLVRSSKLIAPTDRAAGKNSTTSNDPAPNIVSEILAERAQTYVSSNHSLSSSKSGTRGSKRKRNASKQIDNYVEVRCTHSKAPLEQEETIQDIIRPTTSDILLAESRRPTQTAVTFVSNNKAKSVNSLCVLFQVPAEGSSNTRSMDKPADTDGAPRSDIPAVDLTWMQPLQVDYFLTTRSSVVSEARAKLRGMMLSQVTDRDLIHPWALHLAPMPVYMTPHADRLVPFLKQQALDLQRFCSDTLLEFSDFQNKKIAVDKDCLRKILDDDI